MSSFPIVFIRINFARDYRVFVKCKLYKMPCFVTAVGDDGKSECWRTGNSIHRVRWAKSEGGAAVGDAVGGWLHVI